MLSRMGPDLAWLATARLRLAPITAEAARAILAGDLAGLRAGAGWPHEGTRNGLTMAVTSGHPPGWLVTADGVVIGDCGIHGPADETGRVEIGYGLAAPYRGRGYGTEVVAAITGWLLSLPEVREVRAETLLDNVASRRVLEKNGFAVAGVANGHAIYHLPQATARGRGGAGLP